MVGSRHVANKRLAIADGTRAGIVTPGICLIRVRGVESISVWADLDTMIELD